MGGGGPLTSNSARCLLINPGGEPKSGNDEFDECATTSPWSRSHRTMIKLPQKQVPEKHGETVSAHGKTHTHPSPPSACSHSNTSTFERSDSCHQLRTRSDRLQKLLTKQYLTGGIGADRRPTRHPPAGPGDRSPGHKTKNCKRASNGPKQPPPWRRPRRTSNRNCDRNQSYQLGRADTCPHRFRDILSGTQCERLGHIRLINRKLQR